LHNFAKDKHFVGAPAPHDIAEAAYGSRIDEKLKKPTVERLVPCLIDGPPFPRDLLTSIDPLNGNRPRTDYANFGEVTDVAIKRKLRDRRLEAWVANGKQEDGNKIYVQSDDRRTDECRSLRERFDKELGEEDGDVHGDTGVSIGIRGPVTVQSAFSVEPIDVSSTQITKSVSGEGDGFKRGSDTMGMKHRVDRSVYKFLGSMNPQLAEKNQIHRHRCTGHQGGTATVI
jgi:Cas7 group CRISPR-associated protein Csh2